MNEKKKFDFYEWLKKNTTSYIPDTYLTFYVGEDNNIHILNPEVGMDLNGKTLKKVCEKWDKEK